LCNSSHRTGESIGFQLGQAEDTLPDVTSVSLACFQGELNFEDSLEMNPDTDLENPVGVKAIGVMPQRLGTTECMHDSIFGVIELNDYHIVQGPANAGFQPDSMWGKKAAGDIGVHNYNSFKVPVNTGINIDLFQKMAKGHSDMQIFELLHYWFPLDVGQGFSSTELVENHASANKFPAQVQKYIDAEIGHGALKGPIDTSKFMFIHNSPLMTRPKDGDSRQVILDLSWSKQPGASVNSCVPENKYLDTEFLLKLPTVDHICSIINAFRLSYLKSI
jgi:hypothetical protein